MKRSHYLLVFLAVIFVILLGFPLLSLTGKDNGISLNEKINLPFKVEDNKKLFLLYFGYVGCPDVCPASLNEIDNIFNKIDAKYKNKVGFYFINIIQNGDADAYAKCFNKNFKGVDLSSVEVMQFMDKLHAYKSDPLTKSGDLYHTSYLYLVKKVNKDEFILMKMYYTHPYDAKMVINDVKKELK
ncbi:MAG: SCO family protein [Campylobacterales bacterium]